MFLNILRLLLNFLFDLFNMLFSEDQLYFV